MVWQCLHRTIHARILSMKPTFHNSGHRLIEMSELKPDSKTVFSIALTVTDHSCQRNFEPTTFLRNFVLGSDKGSNTVYFGRVQGAVEH